MPKKPAEKEISSKQKPKSISKKSAAMGDPQNEASSKKAPVTQSAKADLIMPIPRIMTMMKRDRLNQRVGKDAGVSMTAMLELVAQHLFNLAGDVAVDNKKKRITGDFIKEAIEGDDGLGEALASAVIGKGKKVPKASASKKSTNKR